MTTRIELHHGRERITMEVIDPGIERELTRGSFYRSGEAEYQITRGKENPVRIGHGAPFMVARRTKEGSRADG